MWRLASFYVKSKILNEHQTAALEKVFSPLKWKKNKVTDIVQIQFCV